VLLRVLMQFRQIHRESQSITDTNDEEKRKVVVFNTYSNSNNSNKPTEFCCGSRIINDCDGNVEEEELIQVIERVLTNKSSYRTSLKVQRRVHSAAPVNNIPDTQWVSASLSASRR